MTRLRAFFADIPYDLNDKTERHYQLVFYLIFKLLGQFVQVEVKSAKGRSDGVVILKDQIYVFEFKLSGSSGNTAEDAVKQMKNPGASSGVWTTPSNQQSFYKKKKLTYFLSGFSQNQPGFEKGLSSFPNLTRNSGELVPKPG
jgi:hypothetical protein